jgi:hypothetical protein
LARWCEEEEEEEDSRGDCGTWDENFTLLFALELLLIGSASIEGEAKSEEEEVDSGAVRASLGCKLVPEVEADELASESESEGKDSCESRKKSPPVASSNTPRRMGANLSFSSFVTGTCCCWRRRWWWACCFLGMTIVVEWGGRCGESALETT